MKDVVISFGDALAAQKSNKARKYPDVEDDRSSDGLVFPEVSPNFRLAKSSSVFTIGSCFARNVEEALVAAGIRVPSLDLPVPDDELVEGRRKNFILNQYNPGTMSEIVKMTIKDGEIKGGLYELGNSTYGDALMSAAMQRPVSYERAIERRREVVELYQTGLRNSDVVVITLGLIEAWYDLEDQVYLNNFPTARVGRRHPDRFEFRRLGVETCHELLSDMIKLLSADRARNIVLTVSPVPLASTFMPYDAVMANSVSKSTLRVVAEELSQSFDFVDYFPSFETVTTSGFDSYKPDQIHVRSPVVGRIVRHMLGKYAEKEPALDA